MRRSFFRSFAAIAIGVTGIVSISGNADAAATTISGSLGSAGAGYKVFLVSKAGSALSVVADASGKFTISTTKTNARNASLQMVDTANRYAGPIVIAKEKVKKNWCVHTKLAGVSVKLGTLVRISEGFGIARKAPSSKTYARAAVLAQNSSGKPLAAGSGGIVKVSSTQMKACSGARVGAKTVSALDMDGTMIGADNDSDGLPNALDADDDGDTIIDAVDSTTTATAALNPTAALRTVDAAFNADINTNLSPADVTAVLGLSGHYSINFFIGQYLLTATKGINDVNWAYVDCGALVYCGGSTPTAYNLNTHSVHDEVGVPWATYYGGFAREDTNQPATSGINQALGVDPNKKGNALYMMNRNGQQDPSPVYWLASMFPNQGANTLNTVKPGDVFTIRYNTNAGDQQVVMMLNPHAVTSPGIVTINGSAYSKLQSGNYPSVIPDANGKLKFTFYRPQRMSTTGETGTFKDMAGLNYGIIYAGPNGDTGCAVSNYSDYSTDFTPTTRTDAAAMLWPLTDKSTTDTDSGASATKITFTLDFRSCIGASTYDAITDHTKSWTIELLSAGQMLTGGANRSSVQLTVRKYPLPS